MNWKITPPKQEDIEAERARNFYSSCEKSCCICGVKFSYDQSISKYCGLCSIEGKCSNCIGQ